MSLCYECERTRCCKSERTKEASYCLRLSVTAPRQHCNSDRAAPRPHRTPDRAAPPTALQPHGTATAQHRTAKSLSDLPNLADRINAVASLARMDAATRGRARTRRAGK